jgi:hypothetical protein
LPDNTSHLLSSSQSRRSSLSLQPHSQLNNSEQHSLHAFFGSPKLKSPTHSDKSECVVLPFNSTGCSEELQLMQQVVSLLTEDADMEDQSGNENSYDSCSY